MVLISCFLKVKMAKEVQGILFDDTHAVTGGAYQVASRSEEHFLQEVITPLYDVLRKVINRKCYLFFDLCISMLYHLTEISSLEKEVRRNRNGKASHSVWRNYDDLNEYFW